MPVVIFSSGSAWMANNGRQGGPALAAELNKAGYAVAGVAIRTSAQTTFPGQLHDIKAAIRWLRANAGKYNLDPDRIGIAGESSGGWLAAMAAVTGDVAELEGDPGHDRRVERGAGRDRLLSADGLPADGRVGAEAVRSRRRDASDRRVLSRRPRVARVAARRVRDPELPREDAAREPDALHQRARTRRS